MSDFQHLLVSRAHFDGCWPGTNCYCLHLIACLLQALLRGLMARVEIRSLDQIGFALRPLFQFAEQTPAVKEQ